MYCTAMKSHHYSTVQDRSPTYQGVLEVVSLQQQGHLVQRRSHRGVLAKAQQGGCSRPPQGGRLVAEPQAWVHQHLKRLGPYQRKGLSSNEQARRCSTGVAAARSSRVRKKGLSRMYTSHSASSTLTHATSLCQAETVQKTVQIHKSPDSQRGSSHLAHSACCTLTHPCHQPLLSLRPAGVQRSAPRDDL